MDLTSLALSLTGILLVFFLPGYTVTKALFPEWRVRGVNAGLRAVEIVTLSLVLSLVLTVLVGFALLNAAPGGFAASWSDPVLEAGLTAIAAVGAVVGVLRGAYRAEAPEGPGLEPAPGADDGWELVRTMEEIDRERRRDRHLLRTLKVEDPEAMKLRARIEELDRASEDVRRRREEAYDQ